jgi:endonuclease/exonuclease/phosphatase family metal-dependent hydrolase
MRSLRFFYLILCAGIFCFGCGEGSGGPHKLGARISIMAYNVMTLFDANDEGGEYEEFSVARGLWDEQKYKTRLDSVAEAVFAYDTGSSLPGPDILCLEEAENARVLEDLRTGALAKARYPYSAAAEREGGPFANCVLSRLPICATAAHSATLGDRKAGRDILEVEFDAGGTRLVIFICHWKSKVDGAETTEEARREAAALVRSRVAARLGADPNAAVVVCGDFNESPDEYRRIGKAYPTAFIMIEDAHNVKNKKSRLLVAKNFKDSQNGDEPVLVSPWFEHGGYSYSYKGSLEQIDGFLLSPAFDSGRSGAFAFSGFDVVDESFLVDENGDPKAWNSKTRSGYSDHLPIVLELNVAAGGKG